MPANDNGGAPRPGQFCLVQLDDGRHQRSNIGVLVWSGGAARCVFRDRAEQLALVKKLSEGRARWRRIREAFEGRLAVQHFETATELERFAATRTGLLRLTPPQFVMVEDAEDTLAELAGVYLDEGTPRARHTDTQAERALERVLSGLPLADRLQRNVEVTLPIEERAERFPFAFQNGALNLIKPASFASTAQSKATSLAVQGVALARNKHADLGRLRLVVVGQFGDLNTLEQQLIQRTFEQTGVPLFDLDEPTPLFEFIEEGLAHHGA